MSYSLFTDSVTNAEKPSASINWLQHLYLLGNLQLCSKAKQALAGEQLTTWGSGSSQGLTPSAKIPKGKSQRELLKGPLCTSLKAVTRICSIPNVLQTHWQVSSSHTTQI